jgi:hypothetical protein
MFNRAGIVLDRLTVAALALQYASVRGLNVTERGLVVG